MKNILFRNSWLKTLKRWEPRQVYEFIVALESFISDNQYEIQDGRVLDLWEQALPLLESDKSSYNNVVERNRKNSKNAGAPKGNKNASKQSKTIQDNPNQTSGLLNQSKTIQNNLKDKDKDNDIVITSEEVITNNSNPDFSSLGGYGKFLENFPPQKVREIELGKQKWDIFSQEEKQEIFRHSTKYIQQMTETGQVKYMKNSLKYLEDEPWLQMNARTFVSKPVERGMINHTLINFYSKEQGIEFDEAQKFLYRSSTDKEYSEVYSRYKKTTQQLFNQN